MLFLLSQNAYIYRERNSKSHWIQTIASRTLSQLRKCTQEKQQKTLFIYIYTFRQEEISGVIGRKSEQCLAQA